MADTCYSIPSHLPSLCPTLPSCLHPVLLQGEANRMLRGKCLLEPLLLQNALPFQINMLILHLVLAMPCKEEEEPKAQQPPKGQERQAGHIHNGKGVSCALVLTIEELRKLYGLSKTKQRGTPYEGVLYPFLPSFFLAFVCQEVDDRNYIYTLTWGFQRCSFRQSGQCEGLSIVERVTGLAPRSLYLYAKQSLH